MVAFDSSNLQSEDAASVNVQNNTTPAPSAPTGLTASLGKLGQSGYPVTLSWKAPTGGATGYYIVRNGATIAQTTSPAYTDTLPADGNQYTYQVIAYNAGGNSPLSSSATVTPAEAQGSSTTSSSSTSGGSSPGGPSTTVAAPTNLTATLVGTSQVNLAWNETDSNAASYDVYRSSTNTNQSSFSKIATVTTTSYGDTSIQSAGTYYYYVVANGATGKSSSRSNVASVRIAASTSSTGSVQGTVKNTQGSPIVGAQASLTSSGKTKTYSTNGSGQYTIPGLSNGNYSLKFSAAGYQAKTANVTVSGTKVTTENVTLSRNSSPGSFSFWSHWDYWNYSWNQKSGSYRW